MLTEAGGLGVPFALAAGLFLGLLAGLALWRREAARRQAAEQAATAVGEERDRLQALLLAAPDGGLVIGGDSLHLSDGVARRFGLADTPAPGLDAVLAVFADDSRDRLRDALTTLRASGESFDLALRTRNDVVIEASGTNVTGRDGASAAVWFRDVSSVYRDLTEAEEALRAARAENDRLGRLLETLPAPLWRRDENFALTWGNRTYRTIVGADTQAALSEIVSPIDPDQPQRLADAARAMGEAQSELRHFVVDGDRRALRVVEAPLPDGGTVGLALDVSELEQAEAELQRHIDSQTEVLNNLSTSIAIFGPDKRLNYSNTAYARAWRMDEDWLASTPTHGEILDAMREKRLMPEQADYPAYKAWELSLYTNLLESREEVLYTPDNRILRRIISPHPLGGLIFIFEDVTDRMALERSYNTLNEVQRETLDNLYEGVAVYGGDGRLKLYNPALLTMWRLDEELTSAEPHVSDLVDAARTLFPQNEPWETVREHLITQVTERDPIAGRMRRPDGRVLDYSSVPLPDGNVLLIYVDATDSVRIERALRERAEAFEAADRLKSEFIANVSYELRTPLNVGIGFAEILTNEYFGELNERQLEYANGILESCRQLLALINDILDLASVEAGQIELDVSTFDLHTMLAGVLSLARDRAQRQKLQLRFEGKANIGSMEGDERRLRQAVFNLVSNALRYTDPGGEIVLGVERDENEIRIWVSDDGVGIAPEEHEMVFESFRRGSRTNRQRSPGLGLALVRSFIELHGGTITLDSEIDEGTTVTLHLPVELPSRAELSAPGGFVLPGQET